MFTKQTASDRIISAIVYGVVTLLSFMCILPIVNTLAVSFSGSTMAAAGKVSLWPRDFTLEAYKAIIADTQFYKSMWISVQRVVLGGGLNFVLTVLVAFPLSHDKKQFIGRDAYMALVIFMMIFSAGLVPIYVVVSKLKLLDTLWALVLPGAVPIWNCILLMNFFRGLSKELEEAAFIDGAQPYQVLLKVFLPVSLPGLATVTLFSLVGHWNEFFQGMIYMNSSTRYPLATYISTMVNASKDLSQVTDPKEIERLMKTSDTTLNSAKIFVAMFPILVVYPFMQRYFVTGLVMGAVKE